MLISVAIPCYKSEKNIGAVVDEIRSEFAARPEHDYQVILVNDGSPDRTDEAIRKICAADSKVTGVLLSRNFTQSNAKMAALPYVKGDVLVFMDDDGQHPASGIFALADKITEGFDVVYAHFDSKKKKQSFFKVFTSDLNGKIVEKMGTRPKGIKTSSFMAYSIFVVEELKKYNVPTPSLGAYAFSVTTKICNIDLEQRERLSGKSGYTLKRLVNLALNGYTNFTSVPLRISFYLGAFFAFLGFIYGLVLVIRKLFFGPVSLGYTSTLTALLILGGLILLSLGLIGEYIGRIYLLLSDKPQYAVRELLNAPEENADKKEGK